MTLRRETTVALTLEYNTKIILVSYKLFTFKVCIVSFLYLIIILERYFLVSLIAVLKMFVSLHNGKDF